MKILVFTDVHISPHNEFSVELSNGYTTYLNLITDSLAWVLDTSIKHKVDRVVCLGDVWDSTGAIDTRSLDVGYRALQLIANKVHTSFVVGNHDLFSGSIDSNIHKYIHNLSILSGFSKVYDTIDSDGDLLFLPWTEDEQLVKNILRSNKSKYIFSHVPITGSKYTNSMFEEKGIQSSVFKGRTVLNGHYHSPFKMGSVINIGSLLSKSFSDAGDLDRGCIILDTNSGSIDRLVNPVNIPFMDYKIGESLDFKTNARLFYKPEEEKEAKETSKKFINCRLIPRDTITQSIIREGSLSSDNTPLDNINNYLDLQGKREDKDLQGYILPFLKESPKSEFSSKIDLKKLKLFNFMSFDNVSLDYNYGITLLEGNNSDDSTANSNGSGKTTLLVESLHWLFTGKLLRPSSVTEVVREGTKKGCYVELELQVDGVLYKIVRSRAHKDFGTGVSVERDGSDISARKNKDTSLKVLDIIGSSIDRIFQTVLLVDGVKARFSELGAKQRLELIEEMGGVSYYDSVRDLVKIDRDTIREDYNRECVRLEEKEYSLTRDEESLRQKKEEHSSKKESIQLEIDSLVKFKDKLTTKIDNNNTLLLDSNTLLESLRNKKVSNKETLGVLSSKVNKLSSMKASKDTEIRLLDLSINDLLKLIDLDLCPTCHQDLKGSSLKSSLASKKEEKISLLKEAKDLETRSSRYLEEVKKCREIDIGICQKEASLNADISQYNLNLVKYSQEVSTIDAKLGLLPVLLEDLESTIGSISKDIKSLKVIVKKQKTKVFKLSNKLDISNWWLSALDTTGIRSFVNDSNINLVNKHLEFYSNKIVGPQIGVVSLSPFKITAAGTVSNKVDIKLSGGRSHGLLSKGQKRRVDLAIQFALHELARTTTSGGMNVIICDEILDPIDEFGCIGVVDILKQKKDLCVYVTTHNSYLKSFSFDNRLTVSMKDGVSSLS